MIVVFPDHTRLLFLFGDIQVSIDELLGPDAAFVGRPQGFNCWISFAQFYVLLSHYLSCKPNTYVS